jgi:hypothetical protein
MTAVVCYVENALTPQNRLVYEVESCSIKSLAPVWDIPFIAFVDGRPVLRADWEQVLEDGQHLAFLDVYCIPQGGGDGGSDPLATVLMLGVLVFAGPIAYSAFGGAYETYAAFAATTYGTAAILGTQFAGMALVSALLPTPKLPTPQTNAALAAASPTYNLQAQGNEARLESAIPEHFGRLIAYPDFAAQPYAEYFGNEQFLYQLLCIGRGSYNIEAFRIEDTPFSSFDDITYQVIQPGGSLSLFPANVINSIEVSGQTLNASYTGPFVVSDAGTSANYIGVDFVAPRGLYYAQDDGSLGSMSASVQIEAQAINNLGVPTGNWVVLNGPSDAIFSGATTTPQRYSLRYAVAAGRYQVRVKRLDTEQTSARHGHIFLWSGLRAYLPETTNFGDVTLLAVRMRASDNLSSQASRKINVICTRKLPIWNGTSWLAAAATTSIAWPLAYACKQVGLTDSQIDLDALLALSSTWAARNDSFNGRFDNFLTFWEAVTKIGSAGRTKPYMQAGVMRFMRDEAATVPVALFSMQNIVKGSFVIEYLMPTMDTADVVNVGYFDENTWNTARVTADSRTAAERAALVAAGTSAKPVKVDIFGVTNRDQAFREGTYLAATNRFRRKGIKFSTEMEGFIPSFGDLILVQHDMPAWGQGGEVIDWDAGTKTLTLSEPPIYGAGTHYIALRKRDGSVDGPFVVGSGLEANQIIITTTPSFTPYTGGDEERTYYSFGWAETWRQRARVLSARPTGLYQVAIEAISEDDNVHTAESGRFTPIQITSQLANYQNAPTLTGATASPMRGNPNVMILSWPATPWANRYVIEQSSDGVTWTRSGDTTSNDYTSPILYGKATIFRVAAVNLERGPWYVVQPDVTPPADVLSITYQLEQFGIRLSWPSIIDIALDNYELRVGGTSWNSATFLSSVYGNEYLWGIQVNGERIVRIKALDTSGNYSVNETNVNTVIPGPLAVPSISFALTGPDLVLGWGIPVSGFLVDRYELRVGDTWETGEFVDSTKATGYRSKVQWLGLREWWITAIDAAGNYGIPAHVSVTIEAPSIVLATRSEVIDNNALLYWSPPNINGGQLPIERYEVRKGSSWSSGSVVGSNGNSTFATVFEQMAGIYIYWVSAVDTAGNFSAPVGITASISQPPDYVLRNVYDSPMVGTRTNFYQEGAVSIVVVDPMKTLLADSFPTKILATYFELYDYSTMSLTDVPLDFNVIYLFNAQPDGGTPGNRLNTGNGFFRNWFDDNPKVTPAMVQTCRNRGQKVILTIGGANAGFSFTTSTQVTNFVNSFQTMYDDFGGLDGIDFNNYEQGQSTTSLMVSIAQQLKDLYGPLFAVTTPPDATKVFAGDNYDLTLAQDLNNANCLNWVGPQYYDWAGYKYQGAISDLPYSGPYAANHLNTKWVNALGQTKVMLGLSANYWGYSGTVYGEALTLPECLREWDACEQAYPQQRGMFCWSAQTNFKTTNPLGAPTVEGGNFWGSTMATLLRGDSTTLLPLTYEPLFGPVDITQTWASHFSSRGWLTIDDQIAAGYPIYATPSLTSGSYEEVITYATDAQSAIPSTIVSVTLNSQIITGDVTATLTLSYRLLSSSGWTVLSPGSNVLLSSFRQIRVHYDFTCTAGDDLLQINALNLKLSMKLRMDSGEGTAAVGGTTVLFNYPFLSCDTPIVQPKGSVPRIPVVNFAGGSNPTGFTVQIFSVAGVDVGGAFSWAARGY